MNSEAMIALGQRVIQIEVDMISRLHTQVDHNFVKACELLLQCQGRIVVTGLGKSGHIGKKISATLASTGSPAFFIHPSEAKHGDIGMIMNKDVILALSNSGESEEIIAILPIIKRLGTPLIALTGNPNSKLAKAATINIDVSVEKEACPLGLAPTASTTASLVMGDALAMVLLEQRGFTQQDFAFSHPGGSLGRRLLLLVDDIMHTDHAIPNVSHMASIKEALVEMTQKKLGMTTITNEMGKIVGIFTDGDVRRTLDSQIDIHHTNIQTVMTETPKIIHPGLRAVEALNLMETHKITALVVCDPIEMVPVGILHIHDILRTGVVA